MSNSLSDLASWALGGVGGANGEGEGGEEQEEQQPMETLTPEEMRAQRLARMEAMQKKQSEGDASASAQDTSAEESPKPMEIDKPAPKNESPQKMDIDGEDSNRTKSAAPTASPQKEHKSKKAKESHAVDPARKSQKKAELLLKKVLSVALSGTSTTSDSSCVVIKIDENAITVQSISEILAERLSLSANDSALRTMPAQKALIPYLAQCHRRASEECKTMKQASKNKSPELIELLEEIKRQVVSYAASTLSVGLFEMGADAPLQLAKCFTSSVTDLASSITFGVAGAASSFYHLLCEELVSSDKEAFDRVIGEAVESLAKSLTRTDSVLDAGDGTEGSALVMVTALTAICSHKKAAEVVTHLSNFLLPPEGSAKAQETVENRPQAGADLMSRLLGLNRSYLRRSGPALDKETILGLCLRPGIPKINPAFSSVRMSMDAVERTTSSQRQQLRVHQEACNQLVMALIKAGPEARSKVRYSISVCSAEYLPGWLVVNLLFIFIIYFGRS